MLVLPNSYLLFCIPLRVPLLSTAKDEEETNKNHIHVSGDGQKTRNVSEYDDGLKHYSGVVLINLVNAKVY